MLLRVQQELWLPISQRNRYLGQGLEICKGGECSLSYAYQDQRFPTHVFLRQGLREK
jgi:hypothetical protein